LELPVVDVSRAELERTDFVPFKALADLPWGMTAHIRYTALDAARPATISAFVIESVIRRAIGFDGLLLSDDLSMQALQGTMAERTTGCLFAGCDAVLHCNGDFDEMGQVALAARPLDDDAALRLERGNRLRAAKRQAGFDATAAEAELRAFLAA
jgi:beta-N-acetylhexosaminidase